MVKHLTQKYAQAGVKACLLTFHQPAAAVFYATPDMETIISLGLAFQAGQSALVDGGAGALFSETQTFGMNGPQYVTVVNLFNAGMSTDKRALIEKLSLSRCCALVQDLAGQWWYLGQERGLRLTFKNDTDAGLAFTLSGREKQPARLVAPSLIPGFLAFLN